jgi:hypothetical protein
VIQQVDTSNRFILGLLMVVGAVLALIGWYRYVT